MRLENMSISQMDVAGIPPIALSIPDFEGQAILRIFSNSTQSQIGCYSGVVTNGSSFSQPVWVSSILGGFTIIAVIASFATAIYGENVSEMRKHYAHSFSVFIVFSTWQHIYFTGALSVNWPSVLVAFWNNYAWAGGIVYSEAMQNTINRFIGANKGNTSQVGAAGLGVADPTLGGGFDVQKIYTRNEPFDVSDVPGLEDALMYRPEGFITKRQLFDKLMMKRELANSSGMSSWYGHPVKPGIPLPGNYSGFAGTLAQDSIPASNAFMTGLLWFLILLAGVIVSVVVFKLVLEGMSGLRMIKRTRLLFFRCHWLGYTMLAALRTLFIGFFTLMFLTLFQFSYLISSRPVAVACAIFLILLLGLGGVAASACFYRIRFGHYTTEPDRLNIEKRRLLKVIPWLGFERNSEYPRSEDKRYAGSIPWFCKVGPSLEEKSIHNDDEYTKKFGWLSARFRRTRWWFFIVWLVYEFARACFLAGALRSPMMQVFGLLGVETVAFIGLVIWRPFEGQRLNVMATYFLGFSKVVTVGLAAAFDVRFGLPRILATAIGIVMIVIQGLLTIAVLICIILGAMSSYMSAMRNCETFHPKRFMPIRSKYLEHLNFKMQDIRQPPKPKREPVPERAAVEPEAPKGPCFIVASVRRLAKVEDEDEEFMNEVSGRDRSASQLDLGRTNGESVNWTPVGRPRSPSIRSNMSYTSLPYGARVHRASWSTQDFAERFAPARPRTLSHSMSTPENGSLFTFNGVPRPTTWNSSGESTLRQPSPLSVGAYRCMAPGTPNLGEISEHPIPRPRSTPRGGISGGSRPQLQPLVSESHMATVATGTQTMDVTKDMQ